MHRISQWIVLLWALFLAMPSGGPELGAQQPLGADSGPARLASAVPGAVLAPADMPQRSGPAFSDRHPSAALLPETLAAPAARGALLYSFRAGSGRIRSAGFRSFAIRAPPFIG